MGKSDLEQCIWEDRARFYRLAYSYVGNEEDALDIVSDSIIKALRNRDGLRDQSAARTWFCRIVVHTACDFLRKRRRIVYTADVPEDGQEDRHEDTDLEGAIAYLPDRLRVIVILRFFEDMKLEEIAYVLDENLNTVKSRLYRALRILKVELSDESAEQHIPAGGHGHE